MRLLTGAMSPRRPSGPKAVARRYRRYCWPTDGLDGVAIAPFQVLACEGQTFHDREHAWHLAVANRLADADPQLVRRTQHRYVDVTDTDTDSQAEAVGWWSAMTGTGGEGMVVKPAANLTRGRTGIVQPGLKVASTSASSPFSRWSPSPSTHGSDRFSRPDQGLATAPALPAGRARSARRG